jgi:hypothetical protein
MNEEQQRLESDRAHQAYWKRWGPYLSERQWGTVREDYSATGEAWDYFPHDHARSRAYRWGEDGILGISDNHQRLCFALALWNERDPILKERLFGLTGSQGNHGEDVKEYYFYLDSTPTHSYLKGLYKYPQAAFPYEKLIEENHRRGRDELEYELLDTGIFDDNRYFDVFVEYAKASPDDVLIRISAVNRGPEPAPLRLLPTLWFRNTWAFAQNAPVPNLAMVAAPGASGEALIRADHDPLGARLLIAQAPHEVLFTGNETNTARIFGCPNTTPYQKDGVERHLVHGEAQAVNPGRTGTKAVLHYSRTLAPGETWTIELRLTADANVDQPGTRSLGADFSAIFETRIKEADEFYAAFTPASLDPDARSVHRQALAGMLWNKQFYHYVVDRWLDGDPAEPPPPPERLLGRNHEWRHLYNDDVLSLPDNWEFPWFASWDLAFHCLPLSLVDAEFAKHQLMLLVREWYMHPNGQLPAYEWAFGDVNPPVHAWGAWRVYTIERKMLGPGAKGDREFLERVFQKLLLNFTWWVNRKDAGGRNIFEGGFLGLDNIGVFDRSQPLPTGGVLEQTDGTSWMAMYALNLLKIAFELSLENPVYEDIASKFFEHFLSIAHAMTEPGGGDTPLWHEDDGLFYDQIQLPNGTTLPLRIHSIVSMIPIFAVEVIDTGLLKRLPDFAKRFRWFLDHRPKLTGSVSSHLGEQRGGKIMFSLVGGKKLKRLLTRLLDEDEYLSPYGIRSISKYHEAHPYVLEVCGAQYRVDYNPGESKTGLFGGNSNWRGPIWMPMNYLLIESLQKFHFYFGDDFKVECPVGSGKMLTLWEVASELSRRLAGIFRRDPATGRRPVFGPYTKFQEDAYWNPYPFFHEYFHADEGRGCGANHQTGWTGLIGKLLQQTGEYGELSGD